MLLFPLLALLGVGAGVLTTVAGVGGSLFIVVVISTVFTPDLALAVTAPALLVGNAHRLYLFRNALMEREVRNKAILFSALALPAAFFGGLCAVELPSTVLRWLLAGVLCLGVAREFGLLRFTVHKQVLVPAALGTGFLTATVGGGSMVMGPTFLASGFRPGSFVAACALASVAMHLGRIPAYALGGWFDRTSIAGAALLAVALIFGNTLGKVVRRGLSDRASRTMTYGTLFGSAAAAALCAV